MKTIYGGYAPLGLSAAPTESYDHANLHQQ